jgi:hypothetical protein
MFLYTVLLTPINPPAAPLAINTNPLIKKVSK